MHTHHFPKSLACLVLSGCLAAHAQPRPDFSGTYVLAPSADTPAPDAFPLQVVIRQSALELTVVRTTPRGDSEATYRLDGVETVESNMLGDTKVRATWQGETLVVTKTRTLTGPDGPTDLVSTESYAMENGGLVIETRQPTPDGGYRSQKLVLGKSKA